MSTTTAAQTVAVLRQIFATNVLPEQLISDNGPQFVSEEFASFHKFNEIKHIQVLSYHPSSNSLAERFVQTFTVAMRKSEKDGLSFQHHLASFLHPLSCQSTRNDGYTSPCCSWDISCASIWTCCDHILKTELRNTRRCCEVHKSYQC